MLVYPTIFYEKYVFKLLKKSFDMSLRFPKHYYKTILDILFSMLKNKITHNCVEFYDFLWLFTHFMAHLGHF